MQTKFFFYFTVCIMSFQCQAINIENSKIKPDTLTLLDQSRNRKIPIAIYNVGKINKNKIPIILNHGYGGNKGGDYLNYSYLANFLAEKGYFVISIQHELPSDDLIPDIGKPQIVRRPFWERGVENIIYVLSEIKKKYTLNYNKLVLIGHSNGGDMCMLFAQKFRSLANKIISLDNRRMEFPRVTKPKIYSIRSNDFPADDMVLPNEIERKQFDITIDFSKINHNNMSDLANENERRYIESRILKYLVN